MTHRFWQFAAAMWLTTSAIAAAPVKTGLDMLRERRFDLLRGKRVGLVTNPTGVDARLVSTIDILDSASRSGQFRLTALYGPEHGVRGDAEAGQAVASGIDSRTGIRVFSLYGRTTRPTREMLAEVDLLVFDIQDIGTRSYTYVSTLGRVMEGAAEAGVPVVVLDRPNPLGGRRVEGSERIEPGFGSFVSAYPIPYVHGMTIGELAQMFNEEGMLRGGRRCDLTVVPMSGWQRTMSWTACGLPWVATSPHIPTAESAFYYPATGTIGELGTLHIGVGYTLPFRTVAARWITDAEELARRLNTLPELAGCRFRAIHYRPFYGADKGAMLHGVELFLPTGGEQPGKTVSLTLLPFYVLQELAVLYPAHRPLAEASEAQIAMFDKVLGSDRPRRLFLESGNRVTSSLRRFWQPSPTFLERRQSYLLYGSSSPE